MVPPPAETPLLLGGIHFRFPAHFRPRKRGRRRTLSPTSRKKTKSLPPPFLKPRQPSPNHVRPYSMPTDLPFSQSQRASAQPTATAGRPHQPRRRWIFKLLPQPSRHALRWLQCPTPLHFRSSREQPATQQSSATSPQGRSARFCRQLFDRRSYAACTRYTIQG